MAATTDDTKRAIIAVLERRGALHLREIGDALGPEWRGPEKNVRLRQMARRMARGGLLSQPGRGMYALSPNYQMRGLNVRDWTEKAIAEFLISRGGVARTREIVGAVGERPAGAERNYDHKLVTTTLARSGRFTQEFGRGYWNLPTTERAQLPLPGWVAAREIERDWVDGGDFDSWEARREEFFDSVGTAFMAARGDLDIADVVGVAEVAAALGVMGQACPAARIKALEATRDDVMEDARTRGVTGAFEIARLVREWKAVEIGKQLYASFEMGNVALHLAAPVDLYRACGALFGVEPARLSRGDSAP